MYVHHLLKIFNPIFFGEGGRGGKFYPLRKIRNNTEYSDAEDLAEISREPNLVLKNLWKFQPNTMFG